MRFDCGIHPGDTASIDTSGTKIFLNRITGTFACEFSSGVHNIIVSAIVNGLEIDQCTSSYSVKDPTPQCKLAITPDTGITSATAITVSGSNLNPRSTLNPLGYGLFFDNNLASSNVETAGQTTFSGFVIPTQYLTPGLHQLDLRYPDGSITSDLINLLRYAPTPFYFFSDHKWANVYGEPLCFTSFKVGTPADPGESVTAGTGGKVPTGPVITGGGKTCGSDPANQGIDTAIGCIHTSPVGFMKDFLRFVIGISGGLAFLMMLLGSFEMITSAGNPDSLKNGKDRFTSAIIGLLFIIFSVLLLQIIGVGVLNIPGFS